MLEKLWNPTTVTVLSATAVQLVLFLRWIYRRIRDDEVMRVFVADMATNHLPHIYDLLARLCDQQNIERPPAPSIRWIDWDDRTR
jgi:hypothetical protein